MSKKGTDIPQGQPIEVIGGGISAGVIEQLQKREELIQVKNKEHLLFFNGNGAWARLVSSVNTITEEEANSLADGTKSIDQIVGDNSLAYNNVLMGGTLKQGKPVSNVLDTQLYGGIDTSLHTPIELDKNSFVKADGKKDIKKAAYNNYGDGIGIRPTPGLVSVAVESKGSYGTLREASIKAKVWSLEDLEVMQTLYLRPGYTVLLEWGHSIQLNGRTDAGVYELNTNIELYRKFLHDKIKDPMLTFEQALLKLGAESSYNYDSFVGYVSNFDWSITEDGGYDCNIKVVAKGSVLESIAVTFDPSNVYPAEQMTRYSLDKGKQERKSIYHKFFTEIERWVEPGNFITGLNADATNSTEIAAMDTSVGNILESGTDFAAAAIDDLGNIISGEGVQNQEAAQAALVNTAVNVVNVVRNYGGAVADSIFGSDDVLWEKISNPSTLGAEAIIAQENEEFKSKIDKLVKGGNFTYKNKSKTFEPSTEDDIDNEGIAGLEEEPVVFYLNQQFGKYGLVFKEGKPKAGTKSDGQGNLSVQLSADAAPEKYTEIMFGTGDGIADITDEMYMYQASDPKNNRYVELDNANDPDDRRESLRIIEFILRYSVIPQDEITPEQLEDRSNRKAETDQQVDNAKANESIAKATNAATNANDGAGKRAKIYTKANFIHPNSKHFKKSLNNFVAFRLIDLEKKDTGVFDNDNLNNFWIPLYTVLDIYNNYVSLVDTTQESSKGTNTPGRKLTQFYTGFQDVNKETGESIKIGKYRKKLKYMTTENHFSINPMVCILPNRPKNTSLQDSTGKTISWPDGQGDSYPLGVVYKNFFHQNIDSAFSQGLIRGERDDILNIMISVQYLEDELDKIVKADEDPDNNSNNNIVKFIKTLLVSMNEAMGGVNDLDLFYEDTDDLYYIVDRKITPALRNLIPTLSISGIKSTMTNVSISSQISKNIGSMISIAAQGTGGNSRDNVSAMLKWNQGCLDRHTRFKAQKNSEGKEKTEGVEIEKREAPEDARLKKWIESYYDYWREFNGDKWWDNGDFNADIVASLGNYHKTFSNTYVTEAYSKNEKDPKPAPGVIPIELSFSTIGLGGLKIGQAFMIEPGLLPQRYNEDFGYIITGLSHKIENSKWTTDVKTQFYYTKKSTPEEIAFFKKHKATSTSAIVPPSDTGTSSSTSGGTSAQVVFEGGPDLYIPPNNRVTYRSDIKKQERPVPVQKQLMDILATAAEECDVTLSISSAGNIPRPQRLNSLFTGPGVPGVTSLGSNRHDNGFAADFAIFYNGQRQNVSEAVTPVVMKFFTAIRRLGVQSIGTGKNYMRGTTCHVDIAGGNSRTGTIKTNFTARDKGPISSWLPQFMRDTRTTTNAPTGTFGGKTMKLVD